MKKLIITIDGPAASGKGTIAKYIKKQFGFYHIDSGLLYRKITKMILDNKINIKSAKQIETFIKKTKNITTEKFVGLRSTKISTLSAEVAKIKKIRNFINLNQKKIAKEKINFNNGIVVDGRDIGSVVFKHAQIKLYIETNPKIRAKRRHKELIDRGEKSIYNNVLKEIKLRDYKDKNRSNSPLVIPKGAVIINNSENILKTKKFVRNYIFSKLF